MSKWIRETWEEVCAKPEIIIHGFHKCGITTAVEGSEDEVLALMTTQSGPSNHHQMMMITSIVNQVKKVMLKIVLYSTPVNIPVMTENMNPALRFTALARKTPLLVVNNTLAYNSVHTVPQYTLLCTMIFVL